MIKENKKIFTSLNAMGGGGEPSQGAIKVETVTDSTTAFPTERPQSKGGGPLHDEDYVVYIGSATPINPKTIQGVPFTKSGEKAYYDLATGTWTLSAGAIVNSEEVSIKNKALESLSGTKTNQSEVNKEFATELKKKQVTPITNPTQDVTISHNYNQKPVKVVIMDENNEEVYGDVSYPSLNSVRLKFEIPTQGTVFISAI